MLPNFIYKIGFPQIVHNLVLLKSFYFNQYFVHSRNCKSEIYSFVNNIPKLLH